MMVSKVHGFLFIGLMMLLGCGSADKSRTVETPAVNVPVTAPPQTPAVSNPRVKQTTITSAITGITYPLRIYLPADYDSSATHYPVIYATDGQWVFNGFSKLLDEKPVSAILVAIEQGPDNRRNLDYLWPGAQHYYQFLITELLPTIEREYRVDASQRTLSGTSYGGVLVGLVLLMDDIAAPHFKNYLSFDASFYEHPQATEDLYLARFNASQEMHAKLVLTSATTIGNDHYVTAFQQALERADFAGLIIHRTKYAVHHNNVADPSFADALDFIFLDE